MLSWIRIVLLVPESVWEEAFVFWAAVTGWQPSNDRGERPLRATLHPPGGDSWLALEVTDTGPGVRVETSSASDDLLDRAVRDGATRVGHDADAVGLRSPGGLVFTHSVERTERRLVRAADSVLDQVCLDIPASRWVREVAFWQNVTGRVLEFSRRPEFAFLGDEDPTGAIRILLQRLNEPEGSTRAHVDFAVGDRDAERRRHQRLGAEVVGEFERWTVLSAPGGQTYCLTDRDPSTGRVRRS